ncbi:MAG: endonuclease/exonuclease/phosphatase family protein [Acidimicrobiales bacterium]|nr:endonuclease/exonuclease/phosphatase family protein [Acidimicrobiales bacterium]
MAESNFGTLIETRLRVATWNLWWRFGPWEERLPAIVETLRAVDADVVCLQEVWLELDSGRGSADVIAEALGAHAVVANRADLDGIGFANAVVSRWPIASHDWRPLYSPPQLEEYRLVLRADIDGPRGPFQIFTTHLHWRLDHSHIRQRQVREICEFVLAAPDRTYPPILCGDFNADPEAEEIRMLTGLTSVPVPPLVFHDAWRFAGEGPGITWSNANPYAARDLEAERRLDYVFVGWPKRGGAGHIVGVELIGTEPVEGVWPSDHYGVCASLRY